MYSPLPYSVQEIESLNVEQNMRESIATGGLFERHAPRVGVEELAWGITNGLDHAIEKSVDKPLGMFEPGKNVGLFTQFEGHMLEITNQVEDGRQVIVPTIAPYAQGVLRAMPQFAERAGAMDSYRMETVVNDALEEWLAGNGRYNTAAVTADIEAFLPVTATDGTVTTPIGVAALEDLPVRGPLDRVQYDKAQNQRRVAYHLAQIMNDDLLQVEVKGVGEKVDAEQSLVLLRDSLMQMVDRGLLSDSTGSKDCPLDLLISSRMKLEDLRVEIDETLGQIEQVGYLPDEAGSLQLKELEAKLKFLMLGAYVTFHVGSVAYAQTVAASRLCRMALGSITPKVNEVPYLDVVHSVRSSLQDRSFPVDGKGIVYFSSEAAEYIYRADPDSRESSRALSYDQVMSAAAPWSAEPVPEEPTENSSEDLFDYNTFARPRITDGSEN